MQNLPQVHNSDSAPLCIFIRIQPLITCPSGANYVSIGAGMGDPVALHAAVPWVGYGLRLLWCEGQRLRLV